MRRKASEANYIKANTWRTKDLPEGSSIEGRYIAKEEFTYNGEEKIKYIIETPQGEKMGVYSSINLESQFDKVPEGSYVWITYTGKKLSNKGREYNSYIVEFDDEI